MLIREDKKIQTNDITLHTAFQHEKILISQDCDTGYYHKEYDGFCVKSDNHKTSINIWNEDHCYGKRHAGPIANLYEP